MTLVRVPASSANLGPGFDALGMALTLYAEIGVVGEPGELPPRARVVDEHHPAYVAFRRGGGEGRLGVRSPIPSGRGLGFSGAMRVGGLVAAALQRSADPGTLDAARPGIFDLAVQLEGHADNAAASLYGGIVATAGGRVVPIRPGFDPAVIAWVPGFETSTQRSRGGLGDTVPFADAVFNVGRTALLVAAALAAGDVAALREATADRLHQDRRFTAAGPSRQALANGLEAGAWCGWLSGSGPTVCLLCDPADLDVVGAALPSDGVVTLLAIDPDGVVVVGD